VFSKLKGLWSGAPAQPGREIELKREGDRLLGEDRYEPAAQAYRQALSLRPAYAEAMIGLGYALAEQGQHDEAQGVLERALTIEPGAVDAHVILGNIARARGERGAAVDRFYRALELEPALEFAYRQLFELHTELGESRQARALLQKGALALPHAADLHANLGQLLLAEGDCESAASVLGQALALQPQAPLVQQWLGDALSRLGRHEEAIGCYGAALELAPDRADALLGMAAALQSAGRLQEAVDCLQREIDRRPDSVRAHQLLGNARLALGDRQGALASYRAVLVLQPQSPLRHLVDALSGETSEQPPAAYVEQLFDEYAENFDRSLAGALRYDVPAKLAQWLAELGFPALGAWRILDLGCGTGLSGLGVRSYAKELVGIDLSGKMLEKARERNLYARLQRAELVEGMRSEPAASFDMVLAADVLVYLGRLDTVFLEAARVVRPGGLLVGSLEAALPHENAADGFQLRPTGRYAHSLAYLQDCAATAGLELLAHQLTPTRLDQGKWIEGMMFACRRPA
jgi:predicted TPR repeat methyltransferase